VSELVGQLEAVVAQHRPTTVFLPVASYNQDHRAVLDAALTALRPHDRNPPVSNVLLYEQVHAVLWPYREDLTAGRAFQPVFFVPIDVERKLAAYRLHASQVRAMRSPARVVLLARWRGAQAGCEFAEGYGVVRLTDPLSLDLGLNRITPATPRSPSHPQGGKGTPPPAASFSR